MEAAVEPPQANLIKSASIASVFLMTLQASGLGLVSSEAVQEIIDIFKGDTVEDLVDDGIITGYDEVLTTEQIKDKLGTSNSNTSVKVNLDAFKTRYTQSWGAGGTVVKLLDTVFQLKQVNGSINDALVNVGNLINDVANKGYITFNQIWGGITNRIGVTLGNILESFKNLGNTGEPANLMDAGWTFNSSCPGYSLGIFTGQYGQETRAFISIINLPGYTLGLVGGNCYLVRIDKRSIGTVSYWQWWNRGINESGVTNIGDYITIDIDNRSIELKSIPDSTKGWKTITDTENYVVRFGNYNDYSSKDNPVRRGYIASYYGELLDMIGGTEEVDIPTNTFVNNNSGVLDTENYKEASTAIDSDTSVVVPKIGDYEIWVKRIVDAINNNEGTGTITDVTNTYINNYAWPTTVLQPDVAIPGTYPLDQVDDSQPFVTPRPDVTAEDAENTVYLGSVPQAIKERFPFSIPWDLYNAFHGLASVQRKAPHIHWDFEAGRWGKLGEVDIDLSDFDSVARLCRNLELLGYIVGLILATRGLIGN